MMQYAQFESRMLEMFYKTGDRITPQLAAYRASCGVEVAKAMLETMAANGIVRPESDERGGVYFELPHRPSPSNEPLSWASNGYVAAAQAPMQAPMQQQPYPSPPTYPYAYSQPQPGNGLAVSGMVLGIIGLLLCWVPLFGLILAVTGLSLSMGGMAKAKRVQAGAGMAIAGLVCSIIALLPAIFFLSVMASCSHAVHRL